MESSGNTNNVDKKLPNNDPIHDVNDKKKQIFHLESILKQKDKEIEILQDALAKSQELIVNIHQSLPLKLFRNYDSSVGKYLPLRLKKKLVPLKEKLTTKTSSEIISSLKNEHLTKKDIVCFPMINWDYRYQRPQHILKEFASKGHRVFYLTTTTQKLQSFYEIEKLADNIYEISLSSSRYFDIYKDKIDSYLLKDLTESFLNLKKDLNLNPLCFVMFPTWTSLVLNLQKSFNFKMVFDCVDEIHEFPNINKERRKEEEILVQNSDLVITSSKSLSSKIAKLAKKSIFIPNAGEFEHFNTVPSENLLKGYQKPIVGYFGAIAEWFDSELIGFIAKKRPDVTFVFIGDTYGSNLKKIQNLENVFFMGERPYFELPKYLHGFDVCLIPFKLTPLIKAAHPIKIYEYLAAGKPVVATKMPELLSLKELCYIASSKEDFLEKLDLALNEGIDDLAQKRIKFAANNTWHDRFGSLYVELDKIPDLDLNNHH